MKHIVWVLILEHKQLLNILTQREMFHFSWMAMMGLTVMEVTGANRTGAKMMT